MGVAVPVFALSVGETWSIQAWNDGIARLTGVSTQRALGQPAEAVLGPGAVALQTLTSSGAVHL